MGFSKVKALVIVSVLLFSVGIITVGCKKNPRSGWVNTGSMPGNTFVSHSSNSAKRSSAIVYLGSDSHSSGRSSGSNFGPKEISFEFHDLK